MRIALAAVLFLAAASAAGQTPVQRTNIALEYDGRLVAATTTLEDGRAELLAERDGEYGLVMQSPLETESVLSATVGPEIVAEDYSVLLPAGPPSVDAPLTFPARAGQTIVVRLVTAAGAPADPAAD